VRGAPSDGRPYRDPGGQFVTSGRLEDHLAPRLPCKSTLQIGWPKRTSDAGAAEFDKNLDEHRDLTSAAALSQPATDLVGYYVLDSDDPYCRRFLPAGLFNLHGNDIGVDWCRRAMVTPRSSVGCHRLRASEG
jgi:hypothetical protein